MIRAKGTRRQVLNAYVGKGVHVDPYGGHVLAAGWLYPTMIKVERAR